MGIAGGFAGLAGMIQVSGVFHRVFDGFSSGYGFDGDEYMMIANDSMVLIPIIESREAVENIDAIVSVDGIDGITVGPMDLSISLGIFRQFEHPAYLAAVERVRVACRQRKKAMGSGCYSLEHAKQCRDLGDTLLLMAGDDGYLAAESRRSVAETAPRPCSTVAHPRRLLF